MPNLCQQKQKALFKGFKLRMVLKMRF